MIKEHSARHHKPFRIRPARRKDGEAVAALAGAMVEELHCQTPALDAAGWRAAGFGPKRVLRTIVAEEAGQVTGFAFYYPGFDLQTATAGLHLCDLYVTPESRSKGVGKALFLKTAMETLAGGGVWLAWTVLEGNAPAWAFYRSLNATPLPDVRAMAMGKEGIIQLLAERDDLP